MFLYRDPNQSYAWQDWSLISVVGVWDNAQQETIIRFYSDNVPRGTATFKGVFVDSINNNHWLGTERSVTEVVTNNESTFIQILESYFHGLMYGFCAYNYPIDDFDGKISFNSICPTGDRCVICPMGDDSSPVCLLDCSYNQYLNDFGECTDCVGCTAGCFREQNCNTCVDPLCNICDDFEICDICVSNASKDPETGMCACHD